MLNEVNHLVFFDLEGDPLRNEILRRGVYPASSPTEGSGERSRRDTQNDMGGGGFWPKKMSFQKSSETATGESPIAPPLFGG